MNIRRRTASAFCALMVFATPAAASGGYDVVIRNARVLDGGGNPWIRADVAIKDGRIAKVGVVAGAGAREIDAKGRYLSPGFIDMMDQSQEVLLKEGRAENKLRMGVTTVIAGEAGTPVEAGKIKTYLDQLGRQGVGVNFGVYYNAMQARLPVMGDKAGTPTPAQVEAMKVEVGKAMQAGAFGVSTALIYPPMSFQSADELTQLASVAGRCGGFYVTHMRDEGAGLVGAIEEAVQIGERSGAKVEIFHLKAGYAPQWGKLMPKAVATIAAARERGVDVAADLYPYTAGGTGLSITAPNWIFADGEAQGWKRLADPAVRARLKTEVAAGSQPGWSNLVEAAGGWDRVVLANAYNPKYDAYRYKSIATIAKAMGKDPADLAWDIVLEALPERATAMFFMIDEGDIALALRQPWVSIGSDAEASEAFGELTPLALPHPRAYGTFPRILSEYVKARKVLSLEDGVRKMTGWPAARMGLGDRGLIREGLRADLVVFDMDRIHDRATWDAPMRAPEGIDYVLVNGVLAIDEGRPTGAKAGQVLRHACEVG